VAGHVHAAGGDFVEQRLPQMGARLLDQGDVGTTDRPSVSPRRVTSSIPPAPPPTTTMRWSWARSSPPLGPRSSWLEPPVSRPSDHGSRNACWQCHGRGVAAFQLRRHRCLRVLRIIHSNPSNWLASAVSSLIRITLQ